jgi:hypothetical protein
MTEIRRLAAIVSAGVPGDTDLVRKMIMWYRGRVVEAAADSLLAAFASAVDAPSVVSSSRSASTSATS